MAVQGFGNVATAAAVALSLSAVLLAPVRAPQAAQKAAPAWLQTFATYRLDREV